MSTSSTILYRVRPQLTNDELNALFVVSWPNYRWRDFRPVLSHSLAYLCAYDGTTLIGYVNLAWDGGIHAFVLDTTVHPDWQRRGIGTELVRRAAAVASEWGIEWLHVDCEPHLRDFYAGCGFQHTTAGWMHLTSET
jgi:GNAT superfamily N-acetyltransferase